MATRAQEAGLEGVRDDGKEAGGAAAESPSWMQMAGGDGAFQRCPPGRGGPHRNTSDPGTSALLEFTIGERRKPAQSCQPAQNRASGILNGCPSLRDPSPQRSQVRAPASTIPRSGLRVPACPGWRKTLTFPAPEMTDEGGSEKCYLHHKACLSKVCRPQSR